MRVLLLVDDYLPESTKAAGRMMHDLALEFQKRGHRVTVVTPANDFQQSSQQTDFEGVTVIRFHAGQIKNIGRIRRAINETLISRSAWKPLREFFRTNPHDCIVYYSPTIFWGPLVGKLKRLWRCPTYLILRDIFPQWAVDAKLISSWSPIYFYFKGFEKLSYQVADTIAVQSPANLELISAYREKSDVLFNWSAELAVATDQTQRRQQLGLLGKVVFFYGGNIGHAQDMMNIVRLAAKMVDQRDVHFLLVGKGDEFDMLASEIAQRSLLNVTLLPAVGQAAYFEMLQTADIGLLTLHRDHKAHNFPGKLLGYLALGKPVLASINPGNDLADILHTAKAGLASINGQDDLLLEHATRLATDPMLRAEMGNHGRELLQSKFSVARAVDQIMARTLNIS
jgi:glycosyltransferase involved in cell wall biosynthesis